MDPLFKSWTLTFLFFLLFSLLVLARYSVYRDGRKVGGYATVQGYLLGPVKKRPNAQNFRLSDLYIRYEQQGNELLSVGDKITVTGIIKEKDGFKFLLANTVSSRNRYPISGLIRFLANVRRETEGVIRRIFPRPHSDLLIGLLLGEKGSFTDDFKEKLIKTGTIHVVVVSGYNISVLFAATLPFFLAISKRWGIFISLIVLVCYVILVGGDPPVVRSAIMGAITMLGVYFGRQRDALYTLILTGFVMMFFKPSYIDSVSFKLSFGATLGILMFSGIFAKSFKINLLGLEQDLYTTTAAQIVVLPIISYYFGRVALTSIIVNFVSLWVIQYGTLLGPLAILLHKVPVVGPVVVAVEYTLLNYFIATVDFFGAYFTSVLQHSASLKEIVLYYVVLTMSYLVLTKTVLRREGVFGHKDK